MKKLSTICSLLGLLLSAPLAWGQVTLTGTSYTQTFDALGSGLPTGWTVRTGASASALGTVAAFSTSQAAWATTTGNFRNVASADGLTSTAASGTQNASTDRAIGLKQTGSFGDPGAAFVLQLANTTGFTGFSASFKLQNVDVQTRNTLFQVDYGTGATPSSFTTIGTTFTQTAFGSNTITPSFGTALDNLSGPVWIRIVAQASTGTGSRSTFALDDFTLNYSAGAVTPAITVSSVTPTSVCVTPTTAGSIAVAYTTAGTFTGTFTAEVSDNAGSFTTPIATGTGASPITVSIPAGTAAGTGYLVRVINSTPSTVSTNTIGLTVTNPPASNVVTLSGNTAQTFASNTTGTAITASAAQASTYQWQYATATGGPYTNIASATSASYTPAPADFGGTAGNTYYFVAVATATTCGSVVGVSAEATVTLTAPVIGTKRWNGGTTGTWTTASNWSPTGVPTASDNVILDHTFQAAAYTVTLAGSSNNALSVQVGTTGNTALITLNITGGSGSANAINLNATSGDALLIADGGVVNNNSSVTGTVNTGINFVTPATALWTMTGTGTYVHNQAGGVFPNVTLGNTVFAATSTFSVQDGITTNYSSGSAVRGLFRIRQYGNLIINLNGAGLNVSTTLAHNDLLETLGDFTLTSPSSAAFRLTNDATRTINMIVRGNVSVTGVASLIVGNVSTTVASELTVYGNVTGTGTGSIGATGAASAKGIIRLAGNLNATYLTPGTTTTAAGSELIFEQLTGTPATPSVLTLATGSTVGKLTVNKALTLASSVPATSLVTVAATGTLDFNGFNTTGTGQFTLVAGGTLKITDPDGITAAAAVATGNVRGTGARTFPNGATYWYTGTVAQTTGTGLPVANGTKIVIADNPTTLTPTASATIQAPGRLEIKQGIFIETATGEIDGTGNLTMSGGTYRLVKDVASGTPPALPQLTGTYALTGGAVELAGAGNQSLRGGVSYNKLRFKNAGTKTLTSAVSNLPDSLVIGGTALLDLTVNSAGTVGSVGLSGPGGLRMSGTSRLRTTRTTATGPAPGMEGEYTLTGGTVEFANTNVTQQTIRGNEVSDPNRTYYNIEVTGTNVGASSGNFAIGGGGTMTVKTGGAFVMTDQVISGAGAFVTEAGSTFGYGSPQGIVASGATGNIRTTTRTFDTGASYILRGTAAMVTGTGLPASVAGLTVSLGTVGLAATLTNTTTVTSTFTLTQGLLALVNQDLTLAAAATLTGGSTTSYVQTANSPTATGELVRPVANTSTDVLFPIGTSTYTPVRLRQVASATTDDFSVRVFDGTRVSGTTGAIVTNDVVNRTWMVAEATAGGSNATLTVQWNAADEAVNFDRTICTVVHYDGTAWNNEVRDYAPATTVAAGVYARAREGLTSFSPFAVQDYQEPLPVELTRFAAAVTPKRTVALTWATASEKNAARFEVQRSRNGHDYQTIAAVEAHGTTNQAQEYRFEDEQPLRGTSYYRLRQVDLDDAAQFSREVVVTVDAGVVTAALDLYPTRFATDLRLTLTAPAAGEATVTVTDLSGRRVLTQALTVEVGSTPLTLASGRLAPGIYAVQVTLPGGEVLRQRAVKE